MGGTMLNFVITLIRVFVFLFLLVIPSVASADDKDSQRNVYDVFSELQYKPPPGITLEEDVTSRIKRYMASLLYPVDLSLFVRPEKDPKFRDLVTVLQKQMGETATGILTYGQFDKLLEAARNIDEIGVGLPPGKLVWNDENSVGARGTGVMNDLANPIRRCPALC
jgi:hypothetical protein